ncbi:cytochrome c-type biogenesis protein [Arsukibacterium sp.]|uniref:cytochrome c-type biogenesis protein n=1 Tax=Arsukibacterium sp. TaxID=1977258 RepID=UPI002FD89959
MKHFSLMILIWLLLTSVVLAQETTEIMPFQTEQQRQLYLQLTAELRCPQCQNQNIADSNAVVAVDMREKTYELVLAGQNRQQVLDYMIERYGYFVHYQPPLNRYTALLWFGPLLLLVGLLLLLLKRRKQLVEDAQLSPEMDSSRLNAELDSLIKKYRSK